MSDPLKMFPSYSPCWNYLKLFIAHSQWSVCICAKCVFDREAKALCRRVRGGWGECSSELMFPVLWLSRPMFPASRFVFQPAKQRKEGGPRLLLSAYIFRYPCELFLQVWVFVSGGRRGLQRASFSSDWRTRLNRSFTAYKLKAA